MKKTLGLMFLLLNGSFLLAQKEDIVLRDASKISRQQVPKLVIDSFEHLYPGADAVRYYHTPLAAAKNAWIMISSKSKSWPDENTTYYTLSFSIKKRQCYALFDKRGKSVKYKSEQKKGQVPSPVKQAVTRVSRVFPGYAATGDNWFKVLHVDSGNSYYEVTITDGSDTKLLYYTPNGHLVKVKE